MPVDTKVCTQCEEEKALDAFHRNARSTGGRHPWCAECKNKKASGYYGRWTPEQREKHKRRVVAWRYGLGPDEYDALITRPCAICDRQGSARGRVCIDHDHQTGRVRGVLCTECNLAIGYLRDDPELLLRAHIYITEGGQ